MDKQQHIQSSAQVILNQANAALENYYHKQGRRIQDVPLEEQAETMAHLLGVTSFICIANQGLNGPVFTNQKEQLLLASKQSIRSLLQSFDNKDGQNE